MALPTAYLVTPRNLDLLFNSLITAKAPDVFTNKFLLGLELKSTNDRLYIGVLKSLGFLDEGGAPTPRYFEFLDQAKSKQVLAEAIKEAYSDLFDINTKAHELPEADVKNKLRTLTQGKYSENVITYMAKTFRALVDYAEWTEPIKDKAPTPKAPKVDDSGDTQKETTKSEPAAETPPEPPVRKGETQLHYNIQIHLPESRDNAVYDAIFKSLRNHLGI